MCLACILKKSGFTGYTAQSHSSKDKEVFYSVFRDYLTKYGPHFEEEVLEMLHGYLLRGDINDQDLLNEGNLENHSIYTADINSKSFENLMTGAIKDDFDVYRIANVPLQYNPLYYTTRDSLKDLLRHSYKGIIREAIFHMPSLDKRRAKHIYKKR